jgi:hypothetical protein
MACSSQQYGRHNPPECDATRRRHGSARHHTDSSARARRHLGLALVVIAAAQLMVVLDATTVNVALPTIRAAVGFSDNGLEWVVNAHTLTFGGFLLCRAS